MPAKVFGGSEGRGRVLTGTSTQNIANVLSHHTIFGISPQLALFPVPVCLVPVQYIPRSRPARSGAGARNVRRRAHELVHGVTVATACLTAQSWVTETESIVSHHHQRTSWRWYCFQVRTRLWLGLAIARCVSARVVHPSGPEHSGGVL